MQIQALNQDHKSPNLEVVRTCVPNHFPFSLGSADVLRIKPRKLVKPSSFPSCYNLSKDNNNEYRLCYINLTTQVVSELAA